MNCQQINSSHQAVLDRAVNQKYFLDTSCLIMYFILFLIFSLGQSSCICYFPFLHPGRPGAENGWWGQVGREQVFVTDNFS